MAYQLLTGVSSMNGLPRRLVSALAVVALCVLPAMGCWAQAQPTLPLVHISSDGARPKPANSWRVAFDEGAASNGTISFRIWPSDDSPIHVDVPVLDGETETQVADVTRDVLAARLGERYRVTVVEGGNVVVSAQRGTPDFTVELLRDTARDVMVVVQRD
jgi:hypothetical protein